MSIEQKYVIIKDRVEIYKDFVINLYNYIVKYYIDDESLSNDDDIYNHYSWCFKKVCNDFLKEEIDFTKNDELKSYFYSYYYNQFYKNTNRHKSLKKMKDFWSNIFDIDKLRKREVIGVLIEIYVIFDQSINSEKNVLELV